MAKTIGQFDFEIIHGKSDIPHSPKIHTIPKHFSRETLIKSPFLR